MYIILLLIFHFLFKKISILFHFLLQFLIIINIRKLRTFIQNQRIIAHKFTQILLNIFQLTHPLQRFPMYIQHHIQPILNNLRYHLLLHLSITIQSRIRIQLNQIRPKILINQYINPKIS